MVGVINLSKKSVTMHLMTIYFIF